MGLFGKKKEEKKLPELPELPEVPESPGQASEGVPELPEVEINELPPLPGQSKSDAVKPVDIGPIGPEILKEKPKPVPPITPTAKPKPVAPMITPPAEPAPEPIPELKPAPRPPPEPVAESEGYVRSAFRRAEPVYIRLDKFQSTVETFDMIKEKIVDIEKLLLKTKELRAKEEEELEEWEREIQIIKTRVETIDKSILHKLD